MLTVAPKKILSSVVYGFLLPLACLLTVTTLFHPQPAHAALNFSANCKPPAGQDLTPDNCGIVAYVLLFINILSSMVGLIVVIMVAYGGVEYTMSKDNPQQAAAAKERIRNAMLALVVFIFMFSFLQWIVPGGVF